MPLNVVDLPKCRKAGGFQSNLFDSEDSILIKDEFPTLVVLSVCKHVSSRATLQFFKSSEMPFKVQRRHVSKTDGCILSASQ